MTLPLEHQRGRARLQVALSVPSLAAYPGAALIVADDGAVLASNARGEVVAAALAEGRLPPVAELAAKAQAGVFSLPAGNGMMMVELAALPAEDGRFLLLGRDITLDRNLRAALVESRQRYKDLVEISSDFAWEVGADRRLVFVSPKGALGYPADELVGREPTDFFAPMGIDARQSPFATALPVEDVEVWMTQADGSPACLLATATPVSDSSGQWLGARGICRDVTQERLREAALFRANNRERLLSYIVRTIRDEVDPVDMLRAAAAATSRALDATGCQIFRQMADSTDFTLAVRYGEGGTDAQALQALAQADHHEGRVEDWQVLATVSRYRLFINGAIILWRSPGQPGWSDDDRLLIDDVANQVGLANEQIANHERIVRLSRTDSLTGLFNRRAFFDEIARRFQRLSRDRKPAALIYVDLDNFKAVNDAHGHQTGDQALVAVRDLLVRHIRPTDLVARLGGDEFAVWLEGAEEHVAVRRCQELLTAGSALAAYSGSADKPLHMSLGVAVHAGASSESLDDLVARADKAMYEVKRDGKGAWRLAPAVEE